jgi:tRNA (guanine37-N1)-methyltransferase
MRVDVVSIFPAYLDPLRLSLVGRAIETGIVSLGVHDLRDATHDRHRTVDDTPYGGGPGMVMRPEPWGEMLDGIRAAGPQSTSPILVIPTPAGPRFDQATAEEWSGSDWLVFACGRYEGIDSRVAEHYAARPDWAGVREVSIGDYVLAGGEAAVLVMLEAVVRLLPGVLGNERSAREDSFAPGEMAQMVEAPVYTKPPEWRDLAVPEVLFSGHHGRIAEWRRHEAMMRTARNRPDLQEDGGPQSAP